MRMSLEGIAFTAVVVVAAAVGLEVVGAVVGRCVVAAAARSTTRLLLPVDLRRNVWQTRRRPICSVPGRRNSIRRLRVRTLATGAGAVLERQ